MPLIEILSLDTSGVDRAVVCRSVNAAVAEALGARPDAVWTTWRTIEVDVRGDGATRGLQATSGPIVHVYHHRTAAQVAVVVEVIQAVLARELSIAPDGVFVTTQPVEMPDPTLE